jgi:DNA-binding XRE family transcriptional regulator
MSDLAKNIKRYRKEVGFTQDELADKIGVNQKTVSFYESDLKTPGFKTVVKIAKALDVSIDTLVGRV